MLRQALLQQRVKAMVERRPADEDPGSARLLLRSGDVREALVRAGLARFCPGPRDEPRLLSAHSDAREEARGIWAGGETSVSCPRTHP